MAAVTEELEEVKEPPLQESVLHMEITLLPWSNRRGNRRWWRRRRRRRKRRRRRRRVKVYILYNTGGSPPALRQILKTPIDEYKSSDACLPTYNISKFFS